MRLRAGPRTRGVRPFLEAISFSHGSVLNLANVARECQIERKTVAACIGCSDLLLAFRSSVHAGLAADVGPSALPFDGRVSLATASQALDPPRSRGAALGPGGPTPARVERLSRQDRPHSADAGRRRVNFVVYGEEGSGRSR